VESNDKSGDKLIPDDFDFEESWNTAIREAYGGDPSKAELPSAEDLLANLSDEDREGFREACRNLKEIFEELTEPQSQQGPRTPSEPTAHQVIYNWISGREGSDRN
jgi:hypothetical protein